MVHHSLSKPGKMPWYSYSLPAKNCLIGTKLRKIKNSTCYFCYAFRGNYVFSNVKYALQKRLESISDPNWVSSIVDDLLLKSKNKEQFFRWHDSGDIQSLEHLEKINEVCLRTPNIRHWLPTREYKIVRLFLKKYGSFAPNLVVRISHPMIGEGKKVIENLPYSYVNNKNSKVYQCPARRQGNKCLECRACWDPSLDVSYEKH